MKRYLLTLAAAVCCSLSLYFIGGEQDQNQSTVSLKQDLAESVAEAEKPVNVVEGGESSAEEQAIDQEPLSEKIKLAFEPPFPERTNIFQAPKRQGGRRASSKDQSETSVELLGFVDVDGQHVALSIDGLVTMVAEGERQNGIEVISIQPPAVVLQRGRQRWRASFEN